MSVTADPRSARPETAEMAGLLDRLRVLTAGTGRPDLADRLARARTRVTDPRMRVVVTGETGQGLSALVDALAPAAPGTRERPVDDEGRLLLVGSPGVSGVDSARAAAALPLVAGADAVLFVSDASRELTEPEITYLDQVRRLCPTVVGVVTKIDRYPRWADVQRANRRHLTQADIDIPLFPVSSRMLAAAHRTRDHALAIESGVPQLADHLRERVLVNATQVLHAGVVNDVRAVTDQVALGLNAELTALRDPAAGTVAERRLHEARVTADALRDRTAGWQIVLADGATELGADVDHDLRHRLRELVREAEADIVSSDPAKRWEEFGSWLDGRVAECVQANVVLAETRSRELAERVAIRFADDGRVALPALDLGGTEALEPVRELEALDSRKAGIVQRLISSMRGSYGGILMVGVMTTLAGLALVNPWSIGAGVLLGANTFREDRKARTARRQAEAKTAVARLMDDVLFHVGRESRFRLREVQRTLRDHFTALAAEMTRTADDALRAAGEARRLAGEGRDARIAEVEEQLGELRTLRVRAAGLVR
ncbi:hypothetical protein LWC33_20480 [Pseudonocardia sp. RS11V-5]|uniref:hypothetical protein n=1 Tax=Pseudonocardia terrae TaxID=2905831 RepID=UPI001E33C7C2|nr:hypothetical protein [Pseudonocardia terrae]MCE3553820.1 hypothetical protein [Pseudonocardia terrae]